MKKAYRAVLIIILITVMVSCAIYGVLVLRNNRDIQFPGNDELERALESGIVWLVENKEKILRHNNHILWFFVQQSAEQTGDSRLTNLFNDYYKRYIDIPGSSYWRPLFKLNSWEPVRFDQIEHLPYYNWHMIYAITCDSDLEMLTQIAEQNDPEYCFRFLYKPACKTHQLMGLRFMQLRGCGDQDQLVKSIASLGINIHRQLVWDVRVVDVYLQRVLMLIEASRMDLVKPIWISNILDVQLEDGGWSNKQPLFKISDDLYFGFTGKGVSIFKKRRGDFHATAQGVFLLSMLVGEGG